MADLNKIYLFRMTHIDNISHILQHGITHIKSANKNPNYKAIGDSSIISTRDSFLLSDKTLLGDYIPFYFGTKMPMLYVIQKGFNGVTASRAKDIVYCTLSVQKALDLNLNFKFTDGHAIDSYSSFYDKDDINNIDNIVDFNAVKAMYWNDNPNDLDKKRRKEAEFLLYQDVPPSAIIGYFVFCEEAKGRLTSLGIPEDKISIRPNFYF